jgi:hypothetical protein
MAPISWSKSAHVNATADKAFEWMTDFQEDDHARPAFVNATGAKKAYEKKPSKRTIVSRQGNTLKILDEWGGQKFALDLELVPLDRVVKMKGAHGYQATWRAVPDEGGAKIEAQVSMNAKGLMGFFMRFFKKKFYRDLDGDFAGHIADLEDSTRV